LICFSVENLVAFQDSGPNMKTLAESGHNRQILICLKPGQKLREHLTPCQISLQIIRGRVRVVQGEKTLEAASGDLVVVSPGSRHRMEAIAESVVVASVTPHPAKDQYPAEHKDRVVPRASHRTV
jgi:quercetin dioxygenase-like cupin family protein